MYNIMCTFYKQTNSIFVAVDVHAVGRAGDGEYSQDSGAYR